MELNSVPDSNKWLYRVERLHNVPALMNDCCDLINMEWKRSRTARLRSIEGSCEDFPMSLVLLANGKKSGVSEVVGHCKISRLSISSTKVFVETVVIHPSLRGKGLGKFLMNAAEEVCLSKNIAWIYLSTMGQEGFYEKLGYTKCAPVSIYGCQFNDSIEDITEIESNRADLNPLFHNNTTKIISFYESPPPPPPPPPPFPVQKISSPVVTNVNSKKTFMRKNLF